MKIKTLTFIVVFGLILGLSLANTAPPATAKPADKKPDKYSQPDTYCYHKCIKYDSIKGQCTDYKWEGTKKRCCQYKTVGQGKCLKYKKERTCKKWNGEKTICLSHGKNFKCSKYEKIEVCEKHEFKQLCKHEGSNGYCKEWGYRDICKEFNKADTYVKCDAYAYIPKLKCETKQRCKHYKVNRGCAKYTKKCKVVCDWQEHKEAPSKDKKVPDNYKPPVIYKKICKQVCNNVCEEFEKKLTCDSYAKVKFCKVDSYAKVCSQPAKKQTDGYLPAPDSYAKANDFCKKKERVRYCIKWDSKKSCDTFKKVRCCLKKKTIKYCAAYKQINFCSQHKKLPKRCAKYETKKTCIEKDTKGKQICVKYEFYGGKQVCEKYADKTKCAQKKKICVPYEHGKKPAKKNEKPKKKPVKKPTTYAKKK